MSFRFFKTKPPLCLFHFVGLLEAFYRTGSKKYLPNSPKAMSTCMRVFTAMREFGPTDVGLNGSWHWAHE